MVILYIQPKIDKASDIIKYRNSLESVKKS